MSAVWRPHVSTFDFRDYKRCQFGMSASSVQFSQGTHLASQGPHFGLEKACPCVGDRIHHLRPILMILSYIYILLQKRYIYIYIIVGLLSMRLSAFAYSDGPATFRFVPKSFYYLISCCKMQLWILSNNIFQLKHEARNSKFRSQPQKLKRMTARKARSPNRQKL